MYKSSEVGKTDCERTVGRLRHRWEGNINRDFG